MTSICLVVQVFIKRDTIEKLWSSLLKCNDIRDIHVIFWQDNYIGSRKPEEYKEKSRAVREYIELVTERDGRLFASVEFFENERNRGTCATCRLAIDHAFTRHERVIFTEDDTLFSRDALDWFRAGFELDDFLAQDVWAISGESVFFDARTKQLEDGYPAQARQYAIDRKLGRQFIKLKFVPSSCFATTAAKWAEFGGTRGQAKGDSDVCKRCVNENKFCVFPIVPRVVDRNMLHPDGFSVLCHTAAKITSVKSTYLTTDDLPHEEVVGQLIPFSGHDGELWRRATLLQGFGPFETAKQIAQ